jgi:hypothetical protein
MQGSIIKKELEFTAGEMPALQKISSPWLG